MKNKKENRGGKRPGAGRKPGKKAFKNVAKKEATKVMRIPKGLVEAVEEMIERYKSGKASL